MPSVDQPGASIVLGAPGAKSFAFQTFQLTMYLAPFLAIATLTMSCVYIALGNGSFSNIDGNSEFGGLAYKKLEVSETFAFLALGTALAHYHWGGR